MAVKKKMLIVNDLLKGGGVEKLMYDLVWHWHDKYDITIMTTRYCEGVEDLYPSNVKYLSEKVKKEYKDNIIQKVYNKIQKKIYRIYFQHKLAKEKFDMVIAMKDGWILQRVERMDIPEKYAWIHTDYSSYYYTGGIFGGKENELNAFREFKKVVCVSYKIRDSIIEVLGDPGNLVVKYNPIDVDAIIEKSKEELVDVDAKNEKGITRFVTVGRLNHQKGYDLLLEACHMLELDGYQFEVWVIGGEEPWADEHNRLYRAQSRMHVTSVKFLGGRRNPYKYMRAADWFLSTSIFEGYSLVSQEAAVLDLPLILTDCSGVRELLGDSEYGIVMEISVIGIYQAMKRVLDYPELKDYYQKKIMERKKTITFGERIRAIEELF